MTREENKKFAAVFYGIWAIAMSIGGIGCIYAIVATCLMETPLIVKIFNCIIFAFAGIVNVATAYIIMRCVKDIVEFTVQCMEEAE